MFGRSSSMRLAALALSTAVACGVRTPPPLDVTALIRQHGAVAARGALEVHLLDHPRDVQVRLALAKLAAEAGRPGQAIEQLEAVLRLGGPLGTRWHASDRARLARLLERRGRARLARGAPTALDDLQRARSFGAALGDDELRRARGVIALVELRHVDAATRARGWQRVVELAGTTHAPEAWVGAKPSPVPRDRGRFGIWLWDHGARRAAWEALHAWRTTTAESVGPIHAAYLRAYAWWHPLDAAPPPAAHLVGPERCRFTTAGCEPVELVAAHATDEVAALLRAPLPVDRTTEPGAAAAWAALTLPSALAGERPWGAAIRAQVETSTLVLADVPAYARGVIARVSGRDAPTTVPLDRTHPPHERLVAAAGLALEGASADRVRAALGDLVDGATGAALVRIVEPGPAARIGPDGGVALDDAVRAYVRVHAAPLVPGASSRVAALVAAYRREPSTADRLARELTAEAVDAAAAHAAVGTVFDALADPARARAAWEAAVEGSHEPAFVRGLALALARAGDPDAALVQATAAAAASGDPAEVWIDVSRALHDARSEVHALEAARYAIELAGVDAHARALEAAIAASDALGRHPQATALRQRRAVVPPAPGGEAADPTDARAAIAAVRREPTAATVTRLWLATRWNPRDGEARAVLRRVLDATDARRAIVVAELIAMAGEADGTVARAAVAALR